MRTFKAGMALLAVIGAAACEVNVNPGNEAAPAANQQANPAEAERQAQLQQVRAQAQQQFEDLRYLVDISDRKLRIFQQDRLLAEHDVAVGTEEWPTPTGSWQLHRVDINPEWIPPKEEEWAEEREAKAPGAPDNPMGRARLVYRMPNTIHGTDDLASLGKASSHGSIRVANEVVLRLAEMLLRAGGAWEGPQWFQQMVQTRNREFQVNLPHPVPIVVQE